MHTPISATTSKPVSMNMSVPMQKITVKELTGRQGGGKQATEVNCAEQGESSRRFVNSFETTNESSGTDEVNVCMTVTVYGEYIPFE